MSNDDNSKDSLDIGEELEDLKNKASEMASDAADAISDKVEDAVESVSEVVEDVTETISETVEDATETISEVVDDVVEVTSDAKDSAVTKIMELKNSNPKVFFGGIGALVLVILYLMMSGDSKPPLPVTKAVNAAVGQTYTLKGVNTTDPSAAIRLVSVPGSMAAYDESEAENDSCKRIKPGTKVKSLQVQQAFGEVKFIEIEMIDGDCAGRKGWVSSNNLN